MLVVTGINPLTVVRALFWIGCWYSGLLRLPGLRQDTTLIGNELRQERSFHTFLDMQHTAHMLDILTSSTRISRNKCINVFATDLLQIDDKFPIHLVLNFRFS